MTGIVGLNAALDFFSELDIQRIIRHEKKLIKQLTHSLENLDYRIISHRDSQSQLAITHAKYHSHDIASILADKEVAVRAGHHCAQPCLSALGVKHCIRASVGLYNTSEDINRLVTALSQVDQILAV